MSEFIIATAGLPGTGKTTQCEMLRDRHGFEIASPPLFIRQHADERGIVLRERSQWAEGRRQLAEIHGPEWFAQMVLDAESDKVVVDGLSTIGDFDTFDAANQMGYANVVCIGLECADQVRLEHIIKRGDYSKEVPATIDEMIQIEEPEYYADGDEYGVARKAVMEQIPKTMTITYDRQSAEHVHERIVRLVRPLGFLL